MHTTIAYDSQYGNTRHVAEAVAEEMRTAGAVDMINVRAGPLTVPDTLDVLIVGGPTQMHHVSEPLSAQLDALPAHRLDSVPVATFDTRVRGLRLITGAASGGIAKALTRRGAKLIAPPESFLVAGTEGPLVEGELERAHRWAQHLLGTLHPTVGAAAGATR